MIGVNMKFDFGIVIFVLAFCILGGLAVGGMNGWGFDGGESYTQYREFEQQMNEVIRTYGDF